jgi:hypothetical protein
MVVVEGSKYLEYISRIRILSETVIKQVNRKRTETRVWTEQRKETESSQNKNIIHAQ